MNDYNIIARQWIETEAKLEELTNELYKLPCMWYIDNIVGKTYDTYRPVGVVERNGIVCVKVETCEFSRRFGQFDEKYEHYVPLEALIQRKKLTDEG